MERKLEKKRKKKLMCKKGVISSPSPSRICGTLLFEAFFLALRRSKQVLLLIFANFLLLFFGWKWNGHLWGDGMIFYFFWCLASSPKFSFPSKTLISFALLKVLLSFLLFVCVSLTLKKKLTIFLFITQIKPMPNLGT